MRFWCLFSDILFQQPASQALHHLLTQTDARKAAWNLSFGCVLKPSWRIIVENQRPFSRLDIESVPKFDDINLSKEVTVSNNSKAFESGLRGAFFPQLHCCKSLCNSQSEATQQCSVAEPLHRQASRLIFHIWVSDESYSSPKGHHQVRASPIGYQCLVILHTCVYSAMAGSSAIDLEIAYPIVLFFFLQLLVKCLHHRQRKGCRYGFSWVNPKLLWPVGFPDRFVMAFGDRLVSVGISVGDTANMSNLVMSQSTEETLNGCRIEKI